jgi:cytochrome c biogenesis protein CcmG/thiol:disulfide interchange protein DsbE
MGTDEDPVVVRSQKRRWVWIVPAVIAVAVIAYLFSRPAPESRSRPRALPAFRLQVLGPDPGSGAVVTEKDLAGKPAVINFWASWCGPCRREAPMLEQMARKYEGRVAFLGVDVQDIESEAVKFQEKYGISYPLVRDPDQVLPKALWTDQGLPQTFYVDISGRVTSGGRGEVVAEDLERELKALLPRDEAGGS